MPSMPSDQNLHGIFRAMDDTTEILDDDFIFYSLLYSSITLVFAMAVLSKFLTNEFRFGFRSFLSLFIVFIGEPLCHLVLKGPSGVAIFGLGCLFVYSILPASHLPAENKAVFVTGCDSGFGQAIVKKLDSLGMKVYAGCLYKNGPGAIELQHTCSNKLKVIQLDVTNGEQIQEAFQSVTRDVGEQGLWGLINNAGIWYVAEIEMTPEKVFRKALEVNLFGMIRVTKTFLPLVRKAKGRVINMSSVTGKVAFEGFGAYCVSKFGIEAYSDTLRMEMRKWGVKVSVVEPSGYNTAGLNTQTIRERKQEIWTCLDDVTKLTYGEQYLDKMYEGFEASIPKYPKDLTPVVRATRSGLLSKRPAPKYVVGLGAGTLINFFPMLPIWLADHVVRVLGFSVRDFHPLALNK